MPGFHVENFGCRAARADGEALSGRLRAAGHGERVCAEADVVVVNTCSVTAEADRAARAFIRRAHRRNPEARIVVTGCYAQRAPEELAGMAGVAAVVGNSHKALTPEIVLGLVSDEVQASSPLGPGLVSVESLMSRNSRPGEETGPVTGHDFSRAESGATPARALQVAEKLLALKGHDFSPAVSGAKSTPALAAEGRYSGISPRTESFSAACLAPESIFPQLIQPLSRASGAQIWVDDRFAHSFIEGAGLAPGAQTRPNLKIQEGCGNRCTFCVIPQTRGPSRSLPPANVMRQVEGFVAAGGKELVLSGINLGRWGRDLTDASVIPTHSQKTRMDGAPNFAEIGTLGLCANPTHSQKTRMDGARSSAAGSGGRLTLGGLVREILERTQLPRLRLSSIEPMDWDAELIGLMREFGRRRLARHAHLPLQSGSDAVLRRMHRRYRPWHYAEKIEALVQAAGPELTVGADVMVGFPGETDGEFEETLAVVRALPFGYLHLFPFSPRPGTPGWALHKDAPVASEAVEERMGALRALAGEKSRAHREQFVGRELEAIALHTPAALAEQGRTAALTENFLPVELQGRLPANELVRVRVNGLNAEGALECTADAEAFSTAPD